MISRILIPPGGWKFKEDEYWIHGETFDDLKENLTAHRASNDKPLGNVEEDIQRQLEKLFPKSNINIIKIQATNGRKHV